MTIDHKTQQAIKHTLHCLVGCGIGDVTGMVIATSLGWDKFGRVALAVALAFLFGYALTYYSVRKHTSTSGEAVKVTLATDTVSILTMETVANAIEFAIPSALMVHIDDPVFWSSLAVAFAVAFVVTVPVNRAMMSRGSHAHHH